MHFQAWKMDKPKWSYINLNIRNYVQSVLDYQVLKAYTEKSVLPRNCTFSQVLSQIIASLRLEFLRQEIWVQ